MNTLLLTIAVIAPLALVAVAIVTAVRGTGRRRALAVNVAALALVGVMSCMGATAAFAAGEDTTAATTASEEDAAPVSETNAHNESMGLGLLAAALVTGLAGIGGGVAVAAGAPAAIAANSENPKTFGKSLIFVALGESIALYGLVISIMILNKLV